MTRTLGYACALFVLLALLHAASPVEAAPAADFNCEVVAQANSVPVYYCEPDWGPTFLMNGYGFMTVVEE